MCDEVKGVCVHIPQPTVDPNILGEPLPTTTEPPPPTTPEPPASMKTSTGSPGLRGASTTAVLHDAQVTPTTAAPEAQTLKTTFAADGVFSPGASVSAAGSPMFGLAPSPAVPLVGFGGPGAPGPAGSLPLHPPPPPGLVPGQQGPRAQVTQELYKQYVYYYYFYYYYHWSDLVTKQHVPASVASEQAGILASADAEHQLHLLTAPRSAPAAAAVADAHMTHAALMKENAALRERLRAFANNPASEADSATAQAVVQQQVMGKHLLDGLIGGDEASSPSAAMSVG